MAKRKLVLKHHISNYEKQKNQHMSFHLAKEAMLRSSSSPAKIAFQQILHFRNQNLKLKPQTCDIFINHRRIDTNKNVAGLLYDNMLRLNLNPFLDSKTMKPGDRLFEKIDKAISECKLGIAVFSPHYCESYFCLHELSMMIELKKKIVPIFVDVKPSELFVTDNGTQSTKEILKFKRALEEAKTTVGLTFDSADGDWLELLAKASDAVMKNLLEVEE